MPIFATNGRTMKFTHNIIVLLSFVINTWVNIIAVDFEYTDLIDGDYTFEVKESDNNDDYYTLLKSKLFGPEKVHIQLYYECLCPHCIHFDVNKFAPVVETMSSYLVIQTYPFGNAKMIDHNGKIEFKCQNGPAECYGNKIHACALDKLHHTTALLYNICLMNSTENLGSDDKSADRCGKSMRIDSEPIINCAKGTRGLELLRYYGEESKKAKFLHVPHVLINGKKYDSKDDFKKAVCAAFTKPPPPCTSDFMY